MSFDALTEVSEDRSSLSDNEAPTTTTSQDNASNTVATSITRKQKGKNLGGRPRSKVWAEFKMGRLVSPGHWAATCKFCSKQWGRATVVELEDHLGNHCPRVPLGLGREYCLKVALRDGGDGKPELPTTPRSKKRRTISENDKLTAHMDIIAMNPAKQKLIDSKAVKAFTCAGIPFRVIENPFFIDFLKELNYNYKPPSRELLSNRLLDQELAKVNIAMAKEFAGERDLTLALDGWSSARSKSIWNFIILTPDRKEYLYKLKDFSAHSHTSEFLAEEILAILEEVGVDKFAAVVSDNGANVKGARDIISQKHPHIFSVRCIAHCLNLLSHDIISYSFADRLIKKCNALATFFKRATRAGDTLETITAELDVAGGSLKNYVKTRWTTVYDSAASVIRLETSLKEVLRKYPEVITNEKIKTIIRNRTFYEDLRVLCAILHPIKKAILTLEAESATLADCFVSLVRIAVGIINLPSSIRPGFKNHCISIMNKRWEDFEDDIYLTAYYLHPQYHGAGLNDGIFSRIMKAVLSYGKKMKLNEKNARSLASQLRKYRENRAPFDAPFAPEEESVLMWWCSMDGVTELRYLAEKILSIMPNSASCERGFSKLSWLCGKQRINLGQERMESISKMSTYYLSNAKKELSYYGQQMTSEQMVDLLRNVSFYDDDLDDGENNENENRELFNQEVSVVIEWVPLQLETIVNLHDSIFAQDAEDIIEEEAEEEEEDGNLELSNNGENDSLQVALDNISDDERSNLDYNSEEIANEALLDL